MLSYAYPSDTEIITLKRAAKICGHLKWATARKRFRNTDLNKTNTKKWRGKRSLAEIIARV